MQHFVRYLLVVGSTASLLTVATAGYFGQISESEKASKAHQALSRRASDAKAKGQKSVALSVGIEFLPDVPSLSSAIEQHTVVLSQLISQQAVIEDDIRLITWYKFKILEELSGRPSSAITHNLDQIDQNILPNRLLPLSENDEFLVVLAGGTVVIDGVTLTSWHAGSSPFVESQKYLLFLTFSPDRKVAMIPLLANGVFRINNEGVLRTIAESDHQSS